MCSIDIINSNICALELHLLLFFSKSILVFASFRFSNSIEVGMVGMTAELSSREERFFLIFWRNLWAALALFAVRIFGSSVYVGIVMAGLMCS